MSLQVSLASGREVAVQAKPGGKVSELRQELSEQLETHPAVIELDSSGRVLEDEDEVPEGNITVVLSRLPWTDDGTDRIQDNGGGEFEVRGEQPKGDTSFNAICEVEFSCGVQYFEIEVVQGNGAFIGIGTKSRFGPGYRLKGLFLGGPGNLSDGGGLLKGGFGEHVASGDVIGVELDLRDPATVGVSYWQNGTPLGQAFAGCPREEGAAVHPVVKAKGKGDRFRLSLRPRGRAAAAAPAPHPAEGKWELLRMMVGTPPADVDLSMAVRMKGKGKGFTNGTGILMTVQRTAVGTAPDPSTFKLTLQVGNRLMTTATVSPGDDGETLAIAAPGGTKMMSLIHDLESQISAILPTLTRWLLTNPDAASGNLELSGPDAQLVFGPDSSQNSGPIRNESLMPAGGGYSGP